MEPRARRSGRWSSAINSAIQEFTPARFRGRVDLAINGSFWIGAAIGALGSLAVLDTALIPEWLGWRARAIGIFYAFGTALGGITGPLVFGALIESGARSDVFLGYVLGGVLMVVAGVVEMWIGVKAERQSLENVAPPLSRV